MDERTAEYLLYVDATLAEMGDLAARGRGAYDRDIAVARARTVLGPGEEDLQF